MALIFIEGFDHIGEDELIDKGWAAFSLSYIYIGSSYGRFGGQGFRCNYSDGYIRKNLGVDKATLYFGFAMRKDASGTPSYMAQEPVVTLRSPSQAIQVRIHVTPGYALSAYNGAGTLLGTSSDSDFPDGRWCYIEGKVVISDTVGEVLLKVNEVTVLNLTNKDTKNDSDYIRYFDVAAIYYDKDCYFDDIYADDSQFHGDCQVKTFMPDADGNSADFTRSTGSNDFECVDEIPTNNDTDYISSDTLNHKSIFGITTGSLPTVIGIQLNNQCRIDEAGNRKITAICRSNGTDYSGTESGAILADYGYEQEIWELDPDDSGAWTQVKLEAAEFGLEITT